MRQAHDAACIFETCPSTLTDEQEISFWNSCKKEDRQRGTLQGGASEHIQAQGPIEAIN